MADVDQWVNLRRYAKFLDNKTINDLDRVGPIIVKLDFENAKPGYAKFKLVPDGGDNIAYKPEELKKKRNPRFRMVDARGLGLKPDGENAFTPGEKLHLPAAGGNRYKLVAKDAGGKDVESTEVFVAWRRIFYRVVAMKGLDVAHISSALQSLETSLVKDKASIALVRVDSSGGLAPADLLVIDPANVGPAGTTDAEELIDHASKQLKFKEPIVSMGFIFVKHLTDKVPRSVTFTGKLSDGRGHDQHGNSWRLDELNKQLIITSADYLWHFFDPDEDKGKHYFENLCLEWTLPVGTTPPMMRKPDDVELYDAPRFGPGGHRQISVALGDEWATIQANKGYPIELVIDLRIARNFRNGSWRKKSGYAALAMTARWVDRALSDIAATVLHETGHALGMVASGNKPAPWFDGRGPDSPDDYYDGPTPGGITHRGRHCKKAMTWDAGAKTWDPDAPGGTPGCVMFGAGMKGRNSDFCDGCKPIVRKVDLSLLVR